MVKAGVYLLARIAPAFAELPWWRPLLVTLGLATMVLGGYRALRQHDLKTLLAYSTVSQLGFLTVIASWGTAHAAVATAVLLLAHGFAKAALFLSVGAVDHAVHTRDLRLLSGLGRRMPVLAAVAGISALSMGGVPLFLGFIAKEEVFGAVLEDGGAIGTYAITGLVAGSALTLAYALRLWWGAFAGKDLPAGDPDAVPDGERRVEDVHAPGAGLVGPISVLAAGSLLLGLVPQLVDRLAAAVSAPYPGAEEEAGLAIWHGVEPALLMSLLALGLGVALFALRPRVSAAQQAVGRALPERLDADRGYDGTVAGVERAADAVTGRTQSGSLPVYLAVISLTAAALPGAALLWRGADLGGAVLVDQPAQVPVALLVVAAALAACIVRSRVPAVLLLGAVGYGVALLYVLQGGADLALTQFLVETLSVVIFLLVLRLLPRRFPALLHRRTQVIRIGIATVVGVFVALFTLAAAGARTRATVAEEMLARSSPEAAGKNVVNVILVDFRGLDTLGEVTVVLTAALGISALVLTARRPAREPGGPPAPGDDRAGHDEDAPSRPDAREHDRREEVEAP
jgi:multicomponent Na+:H+ antiporter subunit A